MSREFGFYYFGIALSSVTCAETSIVRSLPCLRSRLENTILIPQEDIRHEKSAFSYGCCHDRSYDSHGLGADR